METYTWLNCPTCHIRYAIPASLNAEALAKRDKKTIYCPAGHQWTYLGETDLTKERRARQRAEQEQARLAEVAREATSRAEAAVASLNRHKRRTARGVCPCCRRSFVALARHMATQHPEFAKAA